MDVKVAEDVEDDLDRKRIEERQEGQRCVLEVFIVLLLHEVPVNWMVPGIPRQNPRRDVVRKGWKRHGWERRRRSSGVDPSSSQPKRPTTMARI